MYFKQLELFGFKSFAQKTSLHLGTGISAVVGPNGCGKSNISDAIRWVLGERKMSVLRAQSMEDVIFNGSDDRNPLGMAEVTLLLDNSDKKLPLDYAEVSVTRRLFRSGESEYSLNKLPCRRKDIVELFMGTGMGADCYSLIEQGRIDLVLSSKPEERRYIFEDAAGIIKYKSRKDAAIRKIERAEANLLRLQDTIIEVRRQINSLRRQANAARRYRVLQEELRAFELRLALLKYRELSEEHSTLSLRTKELGDELHQASTTLSSQESELEKARLSMLELEKTLSESHDQSRDFQSQIEKRESQIALLRERISAIEAREKRDRAEIEEIERLLESLNEQRRAMRAQEREALEKTEHARHELEAKEQQLLQLADKVSACEREIEELRALSLEKLNRKVSLQNEIGGIETNLEVLSKRVSRLAEQKEQTEQSVVHYANRLSETRRMISSLRAALASLSSEITSQTELIASKQSERDALIAERDSLRDSLSAARSKLSSLEELRDRFEGYDDGVRAVMHARQEGNPQADGVLGTVAELMTTDGKHEAAVEAALGHRLQHIVVENTDVVRRCVAMLKAEQAGRASFIPLSLLQTNGKVCESDRFLEMTMALGNAGDVIGCDERIGPVASALLGSTLIVDSLDTALTLVSSLERPRDIVTLQGETVSALGVIGAGSAGQGRGLLGRKKEIEELKDSIAEMAAAVDAETAKIDSLKREIEHGGELLEKLRSAINSHEVELAKSERDQQQLSDGKKREEEERDVLTSEHSLAVHESQELTKQRRELTLQIEHAKKVEAETQERLRAANLAWNELRQRKESLSAEITDFKVSVSSLELTCQRFKHELGRLDTEAQEANRRISEKKKEIASGEREKATFQRETEDCRAAIQETFKHKRTLDEEIVKLEEQKRELDEKIHALESTLKKARTHMQELGERHHQAEISLAQIEEKLSFLKQKTIDDYRLSMSEVAEEITIEEDFDPEAAAEEAARLRAKIEAMGSVNLIAIEEFEELQQRYDLLIQQETDLRKAKEALTGIIKKINTVTQQMFEETFEQVRNNFHEIFRHLFDGGRASVYLMDPSNPLESGIDISVHPPGKKAQNISLLSGGERALTAIALLFAIFRTKPSPFCVLDEVDAPLDDSNILRFTRLVKMFSTDVQFIIVTHNKRTMELADVLYGVTMEQKGVSQIVSVKLTRTPAFEFINEPTTEKGTPVQTA